MQRKSPLVQVKEPYDNLNMVTCMLSSCNPECTKLADLHRTVDAVTYILESMDCFFFSEIKPNYMFFSQK